MKEFYFILIVAQLFIVLVFLGPLVSHGSYRQLRDTQKQQAQEALARTLDSRGSAFSRFVNGLGVLVLALAIWPIRAGIAHFALFFSLIKLI